MSFVFDNIIFALQRGGGISNYWSELLVRMCRDRHDVRFITNPRAELNIFQKQLHLGGAVPVHKDVLPLWLSRYLPYTAVKKGANLYHSSYYRLPAGEGNISVVSVYDFTYERFRGGMARLVHSMQKGAAIKAASGIVCISESTKRDLLEFYPEVPERRIRVIPLAMSELYQPLKQDRRQLLGPGFPEAPFVLFVGGRHSYKNFALAAKVIAGLPEYFLISVGGGALTTGEREMVQKLLPNRHLHLPAVGTERLNQLYNCAHALLYPSSYEGFGIPVLEAMAAGCPVIAVNASSVPEVCGEAGLLVDEISPDAFAGKILKLENPEFRNEIVARGAQQAKRFSWEKCYRETIAFYKEVMLENKIPITGMAESTVSGELF